MSHPHPPEHHNFYEGEPFQGANWSPPGDHQSSQRTSEPPRGAHQPPVGGPPWEVPRGPFQDPMSGRSQYPGDSPRDNRNSYVPGRRGGGHGPRQRHGHPPSRRRLPKSAAKVVKQPSKPTCSVSIWTAQVGEETFSYFSRIPWKNQMRGTRGSNVGGPFKGQTLDDRHPNEPKAVYTEEELNKLCSICGTLVVHWDTHKASQLHQDRQQAKNVGLSQEPTQIDVVAALRVLQATRPDVLAASLAVASPSLLQAATQLAMVPPPRLGPALGDDSTPSGRAPLNGSSPQQAMPMRRPHPDDSYGPSQKYARGGGGDGKKDSHEACGSIPWKLPRIELSQEYRRSPPASLPWS